MEIYKSSFPPEEKHSIEVIAERIKSGKEFLFSFYEMDNIIGIALLWDLNLYNIVVLDYFAIDSTNRSKGKGREFLRSILNHFRDQNTSVLLEIENPYIYNDTYKIKRQNFYRGLGFKEIKNYNYKMPSIENQGDVEMILMISGERENIKSNELKRIVGKIYKEMYYQSSRSEFYKSELSKISGIYEIS